MPTSATTNARQRATDRVTTSHKQSMTTSHRQSATTSHRQGDNEPQTEHNNMPQTEHDNMPQTERDDNDLGRQLVHRQTMTTFLGSQSCDRQYG